MRNVQIFFADLKNAFIPIGVSAIVLVLVVFAMFAQDVWHQAFSTGTKGQEWRADTVQVLDPQREVAKATAITGAAIGTAINYLQKIGATVEHRSINIENDQAFVPNVVLDDGQKCTLTLTRQRQLESKSSEPVWKVNKLDCGG